MGPTKTVKTKPQAGRGSKHQDKPRPLGSKSKSRISKNSKGLPPVQQKSKSSSRFVKKKKMVYTDKELGIPKLNMVTPVGVDAPKGKKKGKVFVDDTVCFYTVSGQSNTP